MTNTMTRDDLARNLLAEKETLKAFLDTAQKLLQDIEVTSRPAGDVNFSTLISTKALLGQMPEFKKSVVNVHSALKNRMTARVKEIG